MKKTEEAETTVQPGVRVEHEVSVQYDDKGYNCTCGKRHEYSIYVFALWDDELIHTCECGLKWDLLRGDVSAH